MKRLIVAISILLLTLAGVASVHAGTLATENCVTIFENSNGQGDYWQRCDFGTANSNSTLAGDKTNLTGAPLCNTIWWPAHGGDWNDCVSALRVELPAGWYAHFYRDPSYVNQFTNAQLGCMGSSSNGTIWSLSGLGSDDALSSWRVTQAHC